MSKRSLGVLALLMSTLIWGTGPVITKVGLQEMSPFSFGFLRTILSLVLLLPFVVYKGLHKVKREDIIPLLVVGAFGSGINTILFLGGVAKTSATASSAIFATVPLINAIAAGIILREKPTLIRVLGVVIGFLGSALIALGPSFLGQGTIDGDIFGNFLVLGSAFCWVAYIIGSKRLLEKYKPITIITFSLLSGTLILLPLSFLDFLNNPNLFSEIGVNGLLAIAYGGILSGIVAFLLFQWGMQYTSAFEAGIVTYLNPVLTDIFAVPILGEKLSPVFLLGSTFILGGVFLATTYELIKKRAAG